MEENIQTKKVSIKNSDFIKRSEPYYHLPSFRDQIKEIKENYLKFLFIPGAKHEELQKRKHMYNLSKKKKTTTTNFKNPFLILGIFLVFIVLSCAIFAPWISKYDFYVLTDIDFGGKTIKNILKQSLG